MRSPEAGNTQVSFYSKLFTVIDPQLPFMGISILATFCKFLVLRPAFCHDYLQASAELANSPLLARDVKSVRHS